jgi:hypothetical protein
MMLALSDQAIFALINETDKRVYVSYSSRLHKRIGSIMSEILAGEWKYKQMIEDKAKLKLVILEHQDTKTFVKYFIDDFKRRGYYIYNESEKPPVEYRFKIEHTVNHVLVVAVNKRNEKKVLGKFKMFEDARQFLEYVTGNNPTKSLVYSIG